MKPKKTCVEYNREDIELLNVSELNVYKFTDNIDKVNDISDERLFTDNDITV